MSANKDKDNGPIPMPTELIGSWFVLDYLHFADRFRILFDDWTAQTYDLGNDVNRIHVYATMWGVPLHIIDRAIDLAINYSSVQVVIKTWATIPIIERSGEARRVSPFQEGHEHEATTL